MDNFNRVRKSTTGRGRFRPIPTFEEVPDDESVPEPPEGRLVLCQNCNQKIRKKDGKREFHTRRVFRSINKETFQPDYITEVCPGVES